MKPLGTSPLINASDAKQENLNLLSNFDVVKVDRTILCSYSLRSRGYKNLFIIECCFDIVQTAGASILKLNDGFRSPFLNVPHCPSMQNVHTFLKVIAGKIVIVAYIEARTN